MRPSPSSAISAVARWSRAWVSDAIPLAPFGDPLDRPLEPARGPEDQRVLRKHAALHPEPAAHVARDHRETGLRNPEHPLGQQLADPVGVLAAQMEPVAGRRRRRIPRSRRAAPSTPRRSGCCGGRAGRHGAPRRRPPPSRRGRPSRRRSTGCPERPARSPRHRPLPAVPRNRPTPARRRPAPSRGSRPRRRRPGRRHGTRRRARWPGWARAARGRSRSRRRPRGTVSTPARPPGTPRPSAPQARPAPRARRTRRSPRSGRGHGASAGRRHAPCAATRGRRHSGRAPSGSAGPRCAGPAGRRRISCLASPLPCRAAALARVPPAAVE